MKEYKVTIRDIDGSTFEIYIDGSSFSDVENEVNKRYKHYDIVTITLDH